MESLKGKFEMKRTKIELSAITIIIISLISTRLKLIKENHMFVKKRGYSLKIVSQIEFYANKIKKPKLL